MTKSELLSTYTPPQLVDMVIRLQSASEVKNDEMQKLKWHILNLEEANERLQSKLDTYNEYLLPRATKEAKEMIDRNHFTGVRIVTWKQWNNREKSEGKGSAYISKEYEQTMREILNIDTSEIQNDCYRFGIESLQRYLKIPSPIKISESGKQNEGISYIQKCQEEYEKVLKESPLCRTIDKISEDILKQKNNAMAMEFTRIICDLLKRYGIYVHCTKTKFSEKITTNSIEEKYGIAFDSMDFSQHDKEFTDKIKELEEELEKSNREHARTLWEFCDSVKKEDYDNEVNCLQSEIEKYRKAFEDAKKERDCQIVEYQKKIEELEKELEYKDGTKMFETLMENTRGEAKECLARHMYENLRCVFRYEKTADEVNITNFLPTEPIKVAEMLINAEGEYEHNSLAKAISGEDKGTYRIFDISELRQIAEHLLVYCNHHREVGE